MWVVVDFIFENGRRRTRVGQGLKCDMNGVKAQMLFTISTRLLYEQNEVMH